MKNHLNWRSILPRLKSRQIILACLITATTLSKGFSGFAQPILQSWSTAVGSGSGTTVACPTGTAAGDLLIAGLMFEGGAGATLTIPSGWTLIRRTDQSSNVGMATYYKIATASEPVTYSFSNSAGKWSVGISRITNFEGAAGISSIGNSSGTSSLSVEAPSITTVADNSLVLAFYTNKKGASYTPAARTTERYDAPNSAGGIPSNMMASYVQCLAGATGIRTATASETETWATQQIAISQPSPPPSQIIVGCSETATSSAGSIAIPKPDGIAVGDLMIAQITQRESQNNATSSGWDRATSYLVGTAKRWVTILYKVATSTDVNSTTNYTFTVTGANAVAGGITGFRRVNTTTRGGIEVIGIRDSANNTGPINAPGITTLSANSMVLFFGQISGTGTTFPSDNWTIGSNNSVMTQAYAVYHPTAEPSAGLAYLNQTIVGATGNGTKSISASARWGGVLLALKPSCTLAVPTGATGAHRCGTGSVTISATVGSGVTIDWYDAATGGTALTNGTGVTSFNTPSISTTTTYYAEARNTTTGCRSSARTAVTATINELPSAPTGTGASRCGTGVVNISASTEAGGTIDWYSATTGGSPIAGGTDTTSFTTPSISTTTIYYAEARNSTTGCVSTGRTAVTATVNTLPTVTYTTQPGTTVCSNTDVTYSTQSGQSNYVWAVPGVLNTDYSITSGGIGSSSNTVTLKWLTAGSKIVSVNYTNSGGCSAGSAASSTATMVTLQTTANVSIISSDADNTICAGNSITFTATPVNGGTASYQWKLNGTNIGTNFANFTTTTLANNDAVSVVMTSTASCVSGSPATSNSITTTVNALPPLFDTTVNNACNSFTWNGTTYTINGNYTFTTVNATGCDSSAILRLTVYSNSSILTNPSTTNYQLCQNSTTPSLSVSAIGINLTYQWYSSPANSNNATVASLLTGQTSSTFQPPAADTGTKYYFCIVKGDCGNSVTSQPSGFYRIIPTGTWLGSSSNWNNANNWCGGIPTATTNAIIPPGTPNDPILTNVSGICNNLQISGVATTEINGGSLSIKGNLSSNGRLNAKNGTLVLSGNSQQNIAGSMFSENKIRNLVISNPAGVIISNTPGNSLNLSGKLSFGNVNNSFLNTGNNLTLVSDSNSTAAVADITNDGTNSGNSIIGNVTVERYISQARKWQFLSVPTNTTQTFRQSWMEGANNITENPRPGYGTVITDNRADWLTRGFDAQSPGGPSVKLYNSYTGNYDAIPNTSAGINTNFGYMTFIRGDRTATPSNTVRNRTTLRTTGPLKQGEQAPIPIPDSSFVAIGNPYASTIDMGKIYKPNCENYIWIWDPALTSGYGVGAYQTFFGLDFQGYYYYYPTPGGGSYPFNNAFNQIQSGQAFFVRGGDSSASYVQMRESAKMPDSNRLVMRPGQLPFGILRSNLFSSVNNTSELADGISVFLAAGLNNEVGPDDAVKMRNNGINVSLNKKGKQYAVEGRSSLRERDTFFLNMTGLGQGNFEWNVEMQNMNLPGRSAWLVDKFTMGRTRLTLEGFTNYRFSTTTNPASAATDRFMIVFRQSPVKRLEFTRFSGNRTDDRIALSWNVQNENGNWKYEIERVDQKNEFVVPNENRQKASGKGVSEYYFTDNNPLPGVNHYRIKAKDATGNIVYSSKISVEENPAGDFISISPNPVKGKNIRLYFSSPTAGRHHIELLNNAGSVISSGNYYPMPNSNEMRIPLAKNTATGTYFLKVSGESEKNRTALKVIIE